MTSLVLLAVFTVGLLLTLFGAGFMGFLCIAGSIGTGVYFAVKHPDRLSIGR